MWEVRQSQSSPFMVVQVRFQVFHCLLSGSVLMLSQQRQQKQQKQHKSGGKVGELQRQSFFSVSISLIVLSPNLSSVLQTYLAFHLIQFGCFCFLIFLLWLTMVALVTAFSVQIEFSFSLLRSMSSESNTDLMAYSSKMLMFGLLMMIWIAVPFMKVFPSLVFCFSPLSPVLISVVFFRMQLKSLS